MRLNAPLLTVLLTLLTACDASAGDPPIFAATRYTDALAANAKDGKLLVVKATAAWCGPCKMMDRTTWRDPKVEAWFHANGVAIQFDVDREPELSRELGVRAMPTMIAFRNGKELDRITGARDAAGFLNWLEGLARGETESGRTQKAIEAELARRDQLDAKQRYALAGKLAAANRPDEAVEEYVWLWKNIPLQPASGLGGVRGSFMAGKMRELAQRHPAAKARFAELRTEIAAALQDQPANPELRDDWIVLNEVLGDEDATVEWFRAALADDAQRPVILRVGFRLEDLLIARSAWKDLAAIYPDPIAAIQKAAWMADAPTLQSGEEAARLKQAQRRMFRQHAGRVYAAMLAGDREQDARAVVETALDLEPDGPAQMKQMLLDFAIQAGETRPEHEAWLAELPQNQRVDRLRERWRSVAASGG